MKYDLLNRIDFKNIEKRNETLTCAITELIKMKETKFYGTQSYFDTIKNPCEMLTVYLNKPDFSKKREKFI